MNEVETIDDLEVYCGDGQNKPSFAGISLILLSFWFHTARPRRSPGHDGGAIWPAARIRAPGHRPSAFPKDTSEAPFGAKWSTIALGAFPTASGRWYWVLAFFRERRTIAARICSFANAGLGTSAIAALRSEGNAAVSMRSPGKIVGGDASQHRK